MIRWPDARGWIGIGVFALTIYVITLMAFIPELRRDEFFKTLATLIVGTAFVNGVVTWAYSATKSGGELAANNAGIIAAQLGASPPPPEGTGQ